MPKQKRPAISALFPFSRVKTLRTKLLLSYMLVVIIPILAMGIYSLDRISMYVTRQKVESEERSILQLKGNIENLLSSYVDISQQIYFNDQVAHVFRERYQNSEQSQLYLDLFIKPMFENYRNLKPEIVSMTVYTKNQTINADSMEVAYLREETPQWRMYQNAMGAKGLITWELYPQKNGGADLLMYRLLNLESQEAGMLVMRIAGPKIHRYLEGDLEGNQIYMIGPDGTIMDSSVAAAVGKNQKSLPFYESILYIGDNEISDYKAPGEHLKVVATTLELSAFSPGRWTLVKAFPVNRISRSVYDSLKYELIIFVSVLIFAGVLSLIFSNGIGRRIQVLSSKMKRVQEGDFDTRVPVRGDDEIGQLQNSFNTMVNKLKQLVHQVYEMEVQKKDIEIKRQEAQLYALQSQINPHFLFNTLEAILAGLEENNEETGHIIQLLAKSFRRNIQWKDEFIPLQEELNFTLEYLTIQKFRIQEKLSWIVNVPEEVKELKIPKLILQPVVENAVVHGIAMKKGVGTIQIIGRRTEKGLHVIVQDDGIGMAPEELEDVLALLREKELNISGKRIGIKNVYDRLRLYYGQEAGLIIESEEGQGTRVEIMIPLTPLNKQEG